MLSTLGVTYQSVRLQMVHFSEHLADVYTSVTGLVFCLFQLFGIISVKITSCLLTTFFVKCCSDLL